MFHLEHESTILAT